MKLISKIVMLFIYAVREIASIIEKLPTSKVLLLTILVGTPFLFMASVLM